MSNVWFTSDTHFGHKNISGPESSNWREGYRTFKDPEEMDVELIDQINSYVGPDDVLYHLGDFCWGGTSKILQYRNQIACQRIHWILGNHDPKKLERVEGGRFESIDNYKEIYIGGQFIVLSHYAMRVWNKAHHGSWMLYGHSHDSISGDDRGRTHDVSVDTAYRVLGQYRPFSFEELHEILDKRNLAKHHEARPEK